MLVTLNWIENNYNKFNKLYWDNKLPNIKFKISRAKHTWGYAAFRYDYLHNNIIPLYITMSNYYDSPENVKLATLLHEMIHIADYTFHPEHFVRNGRKVSRRSYDAHGYWFNEEGKRITALSGIAIAKHATKEEIGCSQLSVRSQACEERKKNAAIICVIRGTTEWNFYFKTDIYKVKDLKKTINSYQFYRIGQIHSVKYYAFDDDRLAEMRSCGKRLRGWFATNETLMNKLKSIKATEVKF